VDVVNSGCPFAAAYVALAVGENVITRRCAYYTIEGVVDGDLYTYGLILRKRGLDGDDVVAAMFAAAVHSGSRCRSANHYVFNVSVRLIVDHLLQFGVYLRCA